jgi:hypothetical protein
MTGNPLIVFYVEPCMRCTAEAARENYNRGKAEQDNAG